MKIGFTGTRQRGLNESEKLDLKAILATVQVREFHHGDCIGANEAADKLVRQYSSGTVIHIHPPDQDKARAWTQKRCSFQCGVVYPPKPYIARNHDIVDATDLLVAVTPGPELQHPRSGTWATVRYARMLGKVIIFLGQGKHHREVPTNETSTTT
ncbi:MAG TPA: hypothetical protein VMY18_02955 [Acidobacteriota bacterium]|nr:hypothetical protein [Acidobacteriota bacterium]